MRFVLISCVAATGLAPAVGQTPDARANESGPVEALAIFRAPLLREGSYLIEAKSHIEADAQRGFWKLIVDQPNQNLPAHQLRLMPCTRLSEMQRIVEASPNRRITFQVTGPVFVFRNSNYILPTHVPVLMEQETESPPQAAAPEPQPAEPTSTESDLPPSDSAQNILRDLERAAGPLHQPSTRPPSSENATTQGAEDRTSRRVTSGARAASSTPAEKLLPEESPIVERRGRITHTAAGDGGWMFVFDADANGLADPPMRLLPCLLLERMEDYARRRGNNSPALLSGTVYLYNGQNYLLPTVFRVPQERRNLSP